VRKDAAVLRGSRKLPLSRAGLLHSDDRRALHWFHVMLRSCDHRLCEQARDLTAVGALQSKVAFLIAGYQLVTVAEEAGGQQLKEFHFGSLMVAWYVFRQSHDVRKFMKGHNLDCTAVVSPVQPGMQVRRRSR
jgi:hypothetical protein